MENCLGAPPSRIPTPITLTFLVTLLKIQIPGTESLILRVRSYVHPITVK